MGDSGPQPVPLNSPTTLTMPVDSPNLGGDARWFTEIPSRDNRVKAFIHVERETFREMGDVLQRPNGAADFIYLLGWDLGLDTNLGGRTFRELVTSASNARGVAVRAMLYLNQQPGSNAPRNAEEVRFFNGLLNGGAVHDNRYLDFGSHHQKLLVVKHGNNLTGFCGGVDIEGGRNHWHDVHLRIEGTGAFALHEVFVARWTDHPLTHRSNRALIRNDLVAPPARPTTPLGDLCVQVVRTFGNGSRHRGLSNLDIPPPLGTGTLDPVTDPIVGELQAAPPTYSFAPIGERGIFNQLAAAISATSRFIYMEDQYLVGCLPTAGGASIAERLAAKLREPSFKRLVILISRTESINELDLRQAWRRRRQFVSILEAADARKVVVAQYKIMPGDEVSTSTPTFVHSKTWVFDDEFCLVSSANCNRRGYTHDSEVGAAIFDPNPDGNRLYFAHDLRIRLWLKHLDPAGSGSISRRDLLDPVTASRFWSSPAPTAGIERYDPLGDSNSLAANRQPDRRLQSPYPGTSIVLRSFDDDWDTILDPDGA